MAYTITINGVDRTNVYYKTIDLPLQTEAKVKRRPFGVGSFTGFRDHSEADEEIIITKTELNSSRSYSTSRTITISVTGKMIIPNSVLISRGNWIVT
jgi:hypothetical protein